MAPRFVYTEERDYYIYPQPLMAEGKIILASEKRETRGWGGRRSITTGRSIEKEEEGKTKHSRQPRARMEPALPTLDQKRAEGTSHQPEANLSLSKHFYNSRWVSSLASSHDRTAFYTLKMMGGENERKEPTFFVGMTPSTLQVEKKNNERAAKGDIPQSFEGFLAGFILAYGWCV